MVQPQELRIGNYVTVTNLNGYYKVVGIDKLNNDLLPIVSNNSNEIKVVKHVLSPILLTPEILEKVGFEEYSRSEYYINYWLDNGIYLAYCLKGEANIGYGHTPGNYYSEQLSNIPINELHRLQNCYHSSTGQELQITL